MLVISSREFRQNQKKYFDVVDQGEHVIVQRGKDKSYALTPVSKDDLYFNTEMLKKIKIKFYAFFKTMEELLLKNVPINYTSQTLLCMSE